MIKPHQSLTLLYKPAHYIRADMILCRPGSVLESWPRKRTRWRCSGGRRSEPLRCVPDEGNPPETTGTPWLRWVWVSSGSGRTRCLNYWRSFYYLAPTQTLWREKNKNLSLTSYTNVLCSVINFSKPRKLQLIFQAVTILNNIFLIFIFIVKCNLKRYICIQYIWKS